MALEVFIPKMTDNMEEGVIAEWLVKEGDKVEKGQPLLLIETDKATMEIPSPGTGILQGIRPGTGRGAAFPVGTTLAYIFLENELTLHDQHLTHPPTGEPVPTQAEREKPRAVPAVRKLARDLGIDLSQVRGTGPENRITRQDLLNFKRSAAQETALSNRPVKMTPVAARMAASLGIDTRDLDVTAPGKRITKDDIQQIFTHGTPQGTSAAEKPGVDKEESSEQNFEWLELNRIQQITGQRMLESVQTIPQFCLSVDVDATNILELRKQFSESTPPGEPETISITAVLVKAVSQAVRLVPTVNASFADQRVKIYKEINIGVAVGTDSGLIVPVIHSADQKSMAQISRILREFREKAKQMHFKVEELTGSTFTITNLGMFGIDRFQALINPPESAILAVGQINRLPREAPGGGLEFRPFMSLTLTLDHRVVDGMQGAVFLSTLKKFLEKPYLLL